MLYSQRKAYSPDKYIYFVLLISVLSVFIIQIFFPENRLYYGPDSSFHYARIEALVESLKDGRFPVYIDYTRANGYGYAAKLFYSDFTLLPVAFLALIFDLAISFKIYLFLIFLFSGHFTFQAVQRLFKSKYISYISSLLITFSYYKLYSLTYRGALGELLSYVFIPIVVIGSYELIKGNYRKWYVFSIGFALLLMSHLLTSLLTALFIAPFFLFYTKRFLTEKQRLQYLILSCLVALMLSCYGLLPMFEQLNSNEFFLKTQSAWASPAQTKLSLNNMWQGFLGGFPTKGNVIGVGFFLSVLLYSRFFVRKVADKSLLRIGDLCLLTGFILLILISELTPWGRAPFRFLSVIQFPWRLFEYVTFLWSVAIGIYISFIFKTKRKRLMSFSVIILLQIVAVVLFANDYRKHNSYEQPFSLPGLGAVEYLPLKLQEGTPSYWDVIKTGDKIAMKSEKGSSQISEYTHDKSRISFKVDMQEADDVLEIPLFYYKGYSATLNGKVIPVEQSSHGLVEIKVQDKGKVVVDFTGTFIQCYSFYVTVLGFLMVIFYVYSARKNKKSNK